MYTQQVPPPHLASLHSSVAFCCGLRACEHHVSESSDTSFIYKSHGSHHTSGNLGKEDSYFCISFVFLLMCLYLLYFCKFFCMTYMSMNVSVCLVCVNVCSDIALVSLHLVFALIENFCVWKCFLFFPLKRDEPSFDWTITQLYMIIVIVNIIIKYVGTQPACNHCDYLWELYPCMAWLVFIVTCLFLHHGDSTMSTLEGCRTVRDRCSLFTGLTGGEEEVTWEIKALLVKCRRLVPVRPEYWQS